MIIKKYKCNTFAGIKNQDIDFTEGMNVILGPNEAGKSTIVEGIHSVLFKSTKMNNRSSEDKKFREKFMPLLTGDSIDGDLILSNQNDEYYLSKEWGIQPNSKLVMPSEEVLKKEDTINEILNELLLFGEGTYSSFFFSKQIHLKEAIEKITENKTATGEVSTFLRKVIMELDGVSIDDLKYKIDENIDKTLKKWDMDKNYPENNKGISNAYKTGFGEIVECFYNKEKIRTLMNEANEAEEKFNNICNQMKEIEDKLNILKAKKEFLETMENDIITRATLEPQIQLLNNEIVSHAKINQDWPQKESELNRLEKELQRLNKEKNKLETEKELSNKAIEKAGYSDILIKVEKLINKQIEIEKEIKSITKVTKEDIETLESNNNNMLNAEARMHAGVMMGSLISFNSDSELMITQDLDEPKKIVAGDKFKANGYIKIESKNLIELEMKSGDIDFVDLRNKYLEYKQNLESHLNKLKISKIHEAKAIKDKLDALNYNFSSNKVLMENTLGDNSYESLKNKVDSYGDLSGLRKAATIEIELKQNNMETVETLSSIKSTNNVLDKFIEEYKTKDGIFDKIIELKMSLKEMENKLSKLKPVPAEYGSADECRRDLSNTRLKYENYQNEFLKLKEEYHDSEQNLPETSYEELTKEYMEAESQFNKKLKYGQKLLKIKSIFDSTRKHVDESSFDSLTNLFTNYFSFLTNGNYLSAAIDNDFNLEVKNNKQTIIPVSLLSAGTYDSIALALKLSIIEHILGDKKGFVILDDCLVDLDPSRKSKAIELIRKFSNRHQVIFTTCNPDTAHELSGKLIQI